MLDLDGDGIQEVLVAKEASISLFKREADGRWIEWAEYRAPGCVEGMADVAAAFRNGQYETASPLFPDIIVDGVRLRHQEGEPECAAEDDEAASPTD